MRGAQSSQFVIPANDRITIQGQGQFIRCLEANGVFTVSVSHGQEMYFQSGISYTSPDFEDYTEFAMINRTGVPVTVIIAWGFGTVTDNRLTATGNLFVINAPATTLKVDDDETQVQLVNIQNQQANRSAKRTPLTDLTNTSRFRVSGATTTVLTAAANVNGAIIRTLCIDLEGGSAGYVQIGADKMWERLASAASGVRHFEKDIFVPAGQQIILSTAAGDVINAFIEVL